MKRFVLLCLLPVSALAQAIPAASPTLGPAAEEPHWLVKMLLANVLPMLVTILSPLLAAGMAYLVSYLRTLSQSSKMAHVGLVFAESANSVVAELNATLKPKLLKALEDGVLTDKEKEELRNTAIESLKNRLPASLVGSAKDIFGPMFDSWVGGMVERAVVSAKASDASAAPR